MNSFIAKHSDNISGVLSCFDRIIISGTIPEICHVEAAAAYLRQHNHLVFDYLTLTKGWKEKIRANAEAIATKNGLEIEFIRKNNFRKEGRVKKIIEERGDHPGLVHIFSAMETCWTYKPNYSKKTKKTSLMATGGRCLHYYFYFIDEKLGLCYIRVPTWAPFRLQFYFNGHNWLARRLDKVGVGYHLEDNAFLAIDDYAKAQHLADSIAVQWLRKHLDRLARLYCPVVRQFAHGVHWSIMQIEYATDLIFKSRLALSALYEEIIRTAVHAVKIDNIATFLGKRLTSRFSDEAGSDLSTRVLGRRVRHSIGPAALKLYDKFGIVLRIETTCNNVCFFKHHRRVEQRGGGYQYKLAPVRKSIFSLPDLRKIMNASNDRYLEFISSITDPTPGVKSLAKVTKPQREGERSWRGFNLFNPDDLHLFYSIARGEFNIAGFDNRSIRGIMADKSAGQISRMFKRLRVHGLIRKVRGRYRYHQSNLGRQVIMIALKLRENIVLPGLIPETLTQS